MGCASCGSENLRKFGGAVAIHLLGLENLDKPHVHLSPEFESAWTVATRSLMFPNMNWASFPKASFPGNAESESARRVPLLAQCRGRFGVKKSRGQNFASREMSRRSFSLISRRWVLSRWLRLRKW